MVLQRSRCKSIEGSHRTILAKDRSIRGEEAEEIDQTHLSQ